MAIVKVSELISKPLICLNSAEMIGTVSNIAFDSKLTRGVMLKIYNDEDENDASLSFVELKKLRNTDSDACTITCRSALSHEWNGFETGYNNPINCECYNQDGKRLGVVSDVVLDGAGVTAIIVGETEFLPSNLISISDRLIIFNDTGEPIKIPRPKTKVPAPHKDKRTVTLHTQPTPQTGSFIINNAMQNTPQSVPFPISKKNEVKQTDMQEAFNIQVPAQASTTPTEKNEAPLPNPPQENTTIAEKTETWLTTTPQANANIIGLAKPYNTVETDTEQENPPPQSVAPTIPTFAVAGATMAPNPTVFPVPTLAVTGVARVNVISAESREQLSANSENAVDAINNEPSDITLPHKMPPMGRVTPNPPDSAQNPYNFLLGKTVHGTITDSAGNVIALDKAIITAEIITQVKSAGKLVQLALHAE